VIDAFLIAFFAALKSTSRKSPVDAVPLRLDFSTGAWLGGQSAESGALKMELLPGFVRNFAPVRHLRWTAATQFMVKLKAWLMPNRVLLK
jgi:hypothetical protein